MSKIQTWKRITTHSDWTPMFVRLYLICQRYKLESESQRSAGRKSTSTAVFNMSKIQTWKRITTMFLVASIFVKLYLICQRYKLESESQHPFANYSIKEAVFNMSKIQTWKRITTNIGKVQGIWRLYLICQRYKLESESQHIFATLPLFDAVFNMSKIQTWKRITTICARQPIRRWLYLICQRYKLESESQQAFWNGQGLHGCI